MLTSGPQKKHTLLAMEFLNKKVRRHEEHSSRRRRGQRPAHGGPAQPQPSRPARPGVARPGGRLGCGCSPHRRALRSRRPPAIGGPVRGALRAAAFIPPLRGRAPPGRLRRPARANDCGLARKRYTASYARGVALCPSLTRRASAPLARPEEETELSNGRI